MVPQEAISKAGHCKGNGRLGVSLCQLQAAALQIQIRLLILSHPVYFFPIVALKTDCQGIISPYDGLPLSSPDLQASAFCAGGLIVIPVIFL